MPQQLPRLLKMKSYRTKPRWCIVVGTLALAGVQTAAQEPRAFMEDAAALRPPAGSTMRDFPKAEVWQGKKRVDVENQLPYKPAEILYGEPQRHGSKEPPASENRVPAATASAGFNTPYANDMKSAAAKPGAAKPGVVRSAAMSDAKLAHELLTRAKQLAEEGDVATAQRLTEQVRDLLTESSSLKPATPKSRPLLPEGEGGGVAAAEPAVLQAAHREQAPSSGISISSPPAVAAAPRELETPSVAAASRQRPTASQPSEVFRGTAKAVANAESEAALTVGPEVDPRSPNQYVVYNSPSQLGDQMTNQVPAVTVNFDMSNGGGRTLSVPAAATGVPAATSSHPESATANTIVLYFFGGLILGVGLLSGSLFVLAKLIVHAPSYLSGLSPLQAASSKPDPAQRPEIESGSDRHSPEQLAPTSGTAHTSPVAVVERPVRSANVVSTLPSEEKKASGILEGIFQENLRMQHQIGRVAEAA